MLCTRFSTIFHLCGYHVPKVHIVFYVIEFCSFLRLVWKQQEHSPQNLKSDCLDNTGSIESRKKNQIKQTNKQIWTCWCWATLIFMLTIWQLKSRDFDRVSDLVCTPSSTQVMGLSVTSPEMLKRQENCWILLIWNLSCLLLRKCREAVLFRLILFIFMAMEISPVYKK